MNLNPLLVIHSFIKYLLSINYVPGTILGIKYRVGFLLSIQSHCSQGAHIVVTENDE